MASEPTVNISIAGIGLQIDCRPAAVAHTLAAYYHPFSGAPPRMQAEIEVCPPVSGALAPDLGQRGRFVDGALVFAGPAAEGRIDLAQRQAYLKLQAADPAPEIEYFVRCIFALLLLEHGGLLFHAAGLALDGRAYLFFGPSGSGKTTVARLSPQAQTLNDDLVALMPSPQGWIAHATPFWNPTQAPPSHSQAPVAGFYRLVQARHVTCEPLAPAQALAEFVASAPVVSADPSRSAALMGRGLEALAHTPAYRLYFLPDASFWQVILPPSQT